MDQRPENSMEGGGTNLRQLARVMKLVPVLLSGQVSRDDLPRELGERLDDAGWGWALPREDENNPHATLDKDIRRLKALQVLCFGARRKTYETALGRQAPLWVSLEEAQALRLAQAVLDQLGLPEAGLLQGMLERVEPSFLGQRRVMPTVAPSLSGMAPEIWAALQRGLDAGRQMRLAYLKPGQAAAQEVVVDRAALMWLTGTFYLVAYVPKAPNPSQSPYGQLREYHLQRITEVELLPRRVQRAQLPMLEGEALLSAELRGRVPSLHDSGGDWLQLALPEPDGRVLLRFRDPGLVRARQRLLAFGHHLEAILNPPELAEVLAPYLALNQELRATQRLGR